MSQYDVYLNNKGYMLAKDSQGRLLGGACREQIIDPFTAQLARDEPYTRASFRFGDGAGLNVYDGSHRYEWGNSIDARSGRVALSPERTDKGSPYYQQLIGAATTLATEIIDNSGAQYGIAERFQMPTGYTTVRSVVLLVKRDDTVDYTSASAFSVGIQQDAAGPKPGTSIQTTTVEIRAETDPYSPFPDRWRNADWFWIEVTFSADAVVGAGNYYWITVYNAQAQPLHWAENTTLTKNRTRSVHNGTAWQDGTAEYAMMMKVGYKDGGNQFDSYVNCMAVYQGTDKIERMYAGTNYRILYYDAKWAAGHWWESKTIGTPVLQLLEYNDKLFAACGDATDFWYSDGSAPGSTAWTQITGHQANAFAVHDNLLWKADVNSVNASLTGIGDWVTSVVVGDPGTPVQAMVSHGGKLYAAKPEGIYEISYPDTYPTSGAPTANLLLDFSTERYPRTWLVDWHSGLYFPGAGGVYELKNGVLRNAWEDKVDEGALDAGGYTENVSPWGGGGAGIGFPAYTRPRSWAPLYDKGPVAWTAAHPTTRGILFARTNPHTDTSEMIWYDGRNWFSLAAVGKCTEDGGPYTLAEYVTAVFVQDAGGGRGWMWFTEGIGISRTEWPTWTNDTADDPTVEYERYGQFTTPWFSLAQQSKKFLTVKIGLISEQLGSGRAVKVYYRIVRGSAWTLIGTATASPYEELSVTNTTRQVQFKIVLDSGYTSATASPLLEQIDLFYQTLPELTKTYQLVIQCASDQALRTGGVDERTAAQILADLRVIMGTNNIPYVDPEGVSHTVRVTAMTVQCMNLHTGPGPIEAGTEYQAILNLLEV